MSPRAPGTSEASKAGRRLNALASLEGRTPTPDPLHAVPPYHPQADPVDPEEWRRIEDAAQLRRVPPLRHVREAALAAQLPPAADRRGAHALMGQFHRVLNNLNQLLRLAEAEADGAPVAAAALGRTIRITELAAEAVAARRGSAHALIIRVSDAGISLNELARHAHSTDDLPPDEDLRHALASIESAAADVLR